MKNKNDLSAWNSFRAKEFFSTIPTLNNVKIVLIWTINRSGSTFATELLARLPMIFASYEPMQRKLNFDFHKKYLDEPLLEYLEDVIFCRNNITMTYQREVQQDYCFSSNSGDTCMNNAMFHFLCNKARVRLIKITALSLSFAQQLLDKHPQADIFILHLVRDPRGIMKSVRTVTTEGLKDMKLNYFCSRMEEDLEAAAPLRNKYPKRCSLLI